jgi:iron complex outermembrane receptor protein
MPQLSVRSAVTDILRSGAASRGTAGAAAYRAGCAAVLLALGGTAYAQQPPAKPQSQSSIASAPAGTEGSSGELEEVVVTGIRRGIENAIEVKKDSSSIVEAISSEDLGKLPDLSIADSLSRLPGLTSQRAEGRASAISLRGTDPGFTTALLNGREQVSTGDNRSIEFDQYPAELLSSVVVYKTPDAQLVGQGLAGTIDLRTQRPLAYGKRAIAVNLRGERNSQGDLGADGTDKGYRVSFSYIDQFMDGKFGVAFGIARLESPLATQGAGTYEPWHTNGTPSAGGDNPTGLVNPGVGAGVFVTDGIKVRTDMGKNRRDGLMAALEFKPTDNYSSVLDLYYTKRTQDNNARSLEVNLGGYPGPCCDGAFPANTVFGYSQPVIVDNTVVGGVLNQRVPLARNFLFSTEDKIFAAGWNNKFDLGEWTLIGDLSYSKAKRNERQYETNAQYLPDTRPNCTTTTATAACHPVVQVGANLVPTPRNVYDTGFFQLSPNRMPLLSFSRNYADAANVQVGPTIYGAGYSKLPNVEDELKSARFDVQRTMDGFLDGIAFGVNYADRRKDKVQPEGGINTRTGGYLPVPSNCLLNPTNLSYAGAGLALAWDVNCALGANYAPIVYGTPTTPGFDYLIGKNWSVEEKVGTAYVRGTLNHEFSSSLTLKGNIGLQVVNTDQSSTAFYKDSVNGRVLPRTDGKKFTNVLPQLNFVFVLPDEQAIRVGVAREIARARMDQLKASSEFGWDQTTGRPGGSGGNPQLDPWKADAFDLSYEKYFYGNKGYLSVAGFYKDLKTYIYNQNNQSFDFSSVRPTFPANFFPPGVTAGNIGTFSQPVNGEGGKLQGVELTVSLPSEMFWEDVRGLGAIFSISQTNSDISIKDPPGNNFITGNGLGTIPLPGLSKTVWNLTVYYENQGFSARVATRARSKYIGEVTNFANDRAFKYVKGDQITDAQLGYNFSGRLNGLSLLFQVNNLTNAPYIAYAVTEARQQDFQQYGRQYLVGFNYRL